MIDFYVALDYLSIVLVVGGFVAFLGCAIAENFFPAKTKEVIKEKEKDLGDDYISRRHLGPEGANQFTTFVIKDWVTREFGSHRKYKQQKVKL